VQLTVNPNWSSHKSIHLCRRTKTSACKPLF